MNPTLDPKVNPNLAAGLGLPVQSAGATGNTASDVQARIQANNSAINQAVSQAPQTMAQYSPATDPRIGAMQTAQADKLKQLFAYDSQLAQTYFPVQNAPGPSTGEVAMPAGGQMIVDPTIGLRAATDQTKATAGEMADIGLDIAKRKNELTTERTNAMDLLKLFLTSKQQENDNLNSILLKMMDIEATKANKSTGSDALTALFNKITKVQDAGKAAEKAKPQMSGVANSIGEVREVLKANPTANIVYEVMPNGKYAWSIVNAGTPFLSEEEANMAENPDDMVRKLGAATVATNPTLSTEIAAILNMVNPPKTTQQKQADQDKLDYQSITKGLDSYLASRNKTEVGQRINPLDTTGIQIENQKKLLTQLLAKLVERNRISDQDARRYLEMMPAPWMNSDQASAKIQGIKDAIAAKIGVTNVSSSGSGGGAWE